MESAWKRTRRRLVSQLEGIPLKHHLKARSEIRVGSKNQFRNQAIFSWKKHHACSRKGFLSSSSNDSVSATRRRFMSPIASQSWAQPQECARMWRIVTRTPQKISAQRVVVRTMRLQSDLLALKFTILCWSKVLGLRWGR